MRRLHTFAALTVAAALAACSSTQPAKPTQSASGVSAGQLKPSADPQHRMDWWRDARFGMFIHWGLYSIPAGEWGDNHTYGEWILSQAHIPIPEYEKFLAQFNPVKFNADEWVSMAKAAGMRYVVITTKHHDGFCLFDSKYTTYDVMSTPFHRDIMKEMSQACAKQGLTMCWYHSIMDWHHPDYLPRRPWETRSAEGADFNRYDQHLKNQVAELLTNYGPIGVMWFDGQWEGTWTHERGLDLAAHVRKLQPSVIINNRVDKGGDALGMTRGSQYAGDFGTPEQEIPPTGFPGVDWETCMTMNDHWGYNKFDKKFKTTEDLIRKLADIASKGGNFLLNIGPTSEGLFPQESIDRLRDIGKWMDVNGDAIHGTQAGPFEKLTWGRCTQKAVAATKQGPVTRLYLHVFDWPKNGQLVVPQLYNEPAGAYLLADPETNLAAARQAADIMIALPNTAPDTIDSVVVLDIIGKPDVGNPPTIDAPSDIFVDSLQVTAHSPRENVQLRYSLSGDPTKDSPIATGPISLSQTTTVAVQAFRKNQPVSPITRRTFNKETPLPSIGVFATKPGVTYAYYEGDWDKVPDFSKLEPKLKGSGNAFDRKPRKQEEHFGFRYTGFIMVPDSDAYTFYLTSDDGSTLMIDGHMVVDNDGLHSELEKPGSIALASGLHSFTIDFFEKTGGHELNLAWSSSTFKKKPLPASELFTSP